MADELRVVSHPDQPLAKEHDPERGGPIYPGYKLVAVDTHHDCGHLTSTSVTGFGTETDLVSAYAATKGYRVKWVDFDSPHYFTKHGCGLCVESVENRFPVRKYITDEEL
jgi:hypothetical protein